MSRSDAISNATWASNSDLKERFAVHGILASKRLCVIGLEFLGMWHGSLKSDTICSVHESAKRHTERHS